MTEERYEIPVLTMQDAPLPEGQSSPGPFFSLCAALTSMAETVARGRKFNPVVSQHEFNHDVRRLLAVTRARRTVTREGISEIDRANLELFLIRDVGFRVDDDATGELVQASLAAAEAFWDLVEFLQPHVTPTE